MKEKATLRKRVTIMEKEVTKAITQYDERMADLQAQIDETQKARDADAERLSQLVEHYDMVDTNQGAADEEESEFQGRLADAAKVRLDRDTAAALPIQRMYRNMKAEQARKEAEAKSKKKGKGKKGKGK